MTGKSEQGYTLSHQDMEKAIQMLGQWEDALEELQRAQQQIPKDLEALRSSGKEKTVQYREMLAQKLINNNILLFIESHGLK